MTRFTAASVRTTIVSRKDRIPSEFALRGLQGGGPYESPQKLIPLAILNALLLPDVGSSGLHPLITPVNSMRYVLNSYFGGDFWILDDVGYYSTEDTPLDFEVVTNRWRQGD